MADILWYKLFHHVLMNHRDLKSLIYRRIMPRPIWCLQSEMSYNEISECRVQIPFHSTSFITLFFLFHKFKFRVVLQISKFVGKLSHFELKSPSICNSHVAGAKSCLLCITWQILDQGQQKTSLYYIEFVSDLPITLTIITNCY